MLPNGQTDLTKLIIAFRPFANTPKTSEFDWFTGIRKRTKTIIEISTEKKSFHWLTAVLHISKKLLNNFFVGTNFGKLDIMLRPEPYTMLISLAVI